MEGPSTETSREGEPSTPDISPLGRPRPRWPIAVVVLFVVLAVTIATIAFVRPSASWVEAVLAEGRAYIDVPLTTMYTPPPLPSAVGNASSEVSFSSGNITCVDNEFANRSVCTGGIGDWLSYTWSIAAGIDLPVRFVMSPEASASDPNRRFEPDGGNGFTFWPAGPPQVSHYPLGTVVPTPIVSYLNASESGFGISSVLVTKWAMDYVVRKIGVSQGFATTYSLEVDYSLAVVDRGSILALPAANVTLPSAGDLWTPDVPLSVGPGVSLGWDGVGLLSSFNHPLPPVSYMAIGPYFRYNVTPITISAGSAGDLTVRLTSAYFDAYAVTRASWNQTTYFHATVDFRFGSVMLAYIPPNGT